MKLTLSVSTRPVGSHKGSYMSSPSKYCYGKGTTYNYEPKEVNGLSELIPDLLFHAVSPYLYRDGKRDRKSVVGVGNVLFLDIDADYDMTPALFQSLSQMPYQYLLLPTQNHLTPVDATRLYYKYRLILPLAGVTNEQQYKAVARWLVSTYNIPDVDGATYTDARFFAPTFPKVGQSFKQFISGEEPVRPFTVTQEMVDATYRRVGMLDDSGNLYLNPVMYPARLEGEVLTYHDVMAQHTIATTETKVTAELSGRTMSKIYDDDGNSISDEEFKRLYEREFVALGDIASALRPDQRVFCQCPTHHNHTDPNDIRYAWLLKTGSGDTRLYCASDHCKKDYGEYRRITLPKWTELVGEANYGRTTARVGELVSSVTYNIVTKIGEYVCAMNNVTVTEWHEKVEYTKSVMFKSLIDENALYCLVLATVRGERGGESVYDMSLAGGNKGLLNVKKATSILQNGWYSYLFKAGWYELMSYAKDKEISKVKIFQAIVETVASDINFVEVIKERTLLRPSLQYDSDMSIDLSMEGRTMTFINNSFDEPVYRLHKSLTRKGVTALPNYNDTISAFLHHWRLPHGEVMFGDNAIHDLPSLLILFSALNMYSDGRANQRHTTFVITAPSGVGKTALITNISKVGLSNDDRHNAKVFGHEGLYPDSIDDMKNKLWTTGDELSPAVMRKHIVMSSLLGNLTRSTVKVNIKGQVDSEFTSFCKVLWGAKAWDAISMGEQATELRNRLFAITYDIEQFENDDGTKSYFLKLCEHDDGTLDDIIQHWLADRYIQIKTMLLSVPIERRLTLFTQFKASVMTKYAGTLEYDVEYAEDGSATTTVKQVASDDERGVVEAFKILLEYVSRLKTVTGEFPVLQFNPAIPPTGYVDKENLIILESEFLTYCSLNVGYNVDTLYIPRMRSGKKIEEWFEKIVFLIVKDNPNKAYVIARSFKSALFRRVINEMTIKASKMQGYGTLMGTVSHKDRSNKVADLYEKSFPRLKAHFEWWVGKNARATYYVVPIEFIEEYIESKS